MVRAVRGRLVLVLIAGAAIASGACGSSDGDHCVKTLCDPSTFGRVCLGHAVQSCAADGKSFVLSACGDQQRCDASGGQAQCVARACTNLGQATCTTVTALERCKDDGSGTETVDCAAGSVCKDGACVPSSCANESDRCSTHGFLTCTNAAWQQQNCPVSNVCTVDAVGVAHCNATTCTPEARRCDGDTVRVCDAHGAGETPIACAKDEVCRDGVCQAAVCGATSEPDASDASDASDTPDADPPSRIIFTLNGVVNTFDISAFAQFDAGDRAVTVTASKSTKRLEIILSPAGQTVAGEFKSDVFNPIKAVVCYDSGGTPAGFEECPDYTNRSTIYDVNVTRNDGQGGRFIADFTATLEDVNTDTTALTGGQINVQYR